MSGRYFQLYCFFMGIEEAGLKWLPIPLQASEVSLAGQNVSVKPASAVVASQLETERWSGCEASAGGQSCEFMMFEAASEALSIETSR